MQVPAELEQVPEPVSQPTLPLRLRPLPPKQMELFDIEPV